MRRRVWIWFGLYCLFSASMWLLSPGSAWVRCGVFALVGVVALLINGLRPWNRLRDVLRLGLAAILFLGVPELLMDWSRHHVSSLIGTTTLVLVPIILVLVAAQRGTDGGAEGLRLLVPAVIGLGGFLLLVPADLPGSLSGWLAMVVLVISAIMVAIASVEIHRLLRNFGLVQAVAIFCLANALVLVGSALLERPSQWSFSLGILVSCGETAGSVVLLVTLLQEMDPVRFASRYLVVPLLVVVEGYILLRPELTLRTEFGVGLLTGGASLLLFFRRTDEVSPLSLH